jgi:nicotinamidase-related amidase
MVRLRRAEYLGGALRHLGVPPAGIFRKEKAMDAALLVIDLQEEFARRTASGRARSNPGAEAAVAEVLALFRREGWPVVHVHHDDPRPGSAFRRDKPGYVPMACAAPVPGEAVFVKSTSGAFASTELAEWLRACGISRLVVMGASVNHCVSSTVRSGFDLGFRMAMVKDAVFGFDLTGADGRVIDPETVLEVVFATLTPELATSLRAGEVAEWMRAR